MISTGIRAARGVIAPAALALVLALAGCAGAQLPADAKTTVLSIANLDCADCADKLATELRERPGVYAATFDKRKSEVTIAAASSFDALIEARALAKGEQYQVELGAGHGGYIAWTKPPEGADVATVSSDGADVPDLTVHLVKGKVTVIDFGAIWCEPCRKLDDHMMGLIAKRSDVAYRKLDIGDWDTPLAQRYLKGIPALPYVLVYDKAGQKLEAIAGLDLQKLDLAIAKGAP